MLLEENIKEYIYDLGVGEKDFLNKTQKTLTYKKIINWISSKPKSLLIKDIFKEKKIQVFYRLGRKFHTSVTKYVIHICDKGCASKTTPFKSEQRT